MLRFVGKNHFERTASCLFTQCDGFASSSLYAVLNVSPKATQKEIKEAFYRNSKIFHPDVNSTPEAKKKFQKISEAYQVLGNPLHRRNYDRGLKITSRSLTSVDESDSPFHSRGAEAFRDGTWVDKRSRTATGQVQFEEFFRTTYAENLQRKFMSNENKQKITPSVGMGGGKRTDQMHAPVILIVGGLVGYSVIEFFRSYLIG